MKKKIVLGLFILNVMLYAQNKRIDVPMGYLTSVDESSVMELFCRQAWDGNQLLNDSINCECNQLIFSVPDTLEIQKETRVLDSIANANPKDIKKQTDDLCTSILKSQSKLKYPHQWQMDLQNKLKDICNDPKYRKDPVRILKAVDMNKSTLKLKINSFRKGFKNNGNGKWVSYETNSGLCGLDMVITIERASAYQWKYTQIRTAVSDTSDLCTGLQESLNKPVVFTQEKEPIFRFQGYEYIEVGP